MEFHYNLLEDSVLEVATEMVSELCMSATSVEDVRADIEACIRRTLGQHGVTEWAEHTLPVASEPPDASGAAPPAAPALPAPSALRPAFCACIVSPAAS